MKTLEEEDLEQVCYTQESAQASESEIHLLMVHKRKEMQHIPNDTLTVV